MSPTLAQAFNAEVGALKAEIETERAGLEVQEDREKSERSRIRIRFLAKQLEAMQAAQSSITRTADEVQSMPLRWDRWRALCREARAAKDEMEEFEKKLSPARAAVTEGANDVARAEYALAVAQQAPLPAFATQQEIRRKEDQVRKLVEASQAAIENVKRLATSRDGLEQAFFNVRTKFENLQFRERMARLPDDPAADAANVGKAWVVGTTR